MRRAGIVLVALVIGCGRQPAGYPLAGRPVRAHGRTAAEWAAALRGPDVKARRKAVAELANLGPADPAVVPALAAALSDRDAAVRDAAAVALYALGPAARDAAPALEAAQADRDPKVRDHAARALARVRS